jgi:nitrous oxidase accessory protein
MQVGIAGGGGRAENNAWTVGERGNYWSDYTGYDGDNDGLGDIPYKSERLFESILDYNSSLRLFLYSPVEQAIDFAARAVPFVKPKPKLTDEMPLMDPLIPTDVPTAPSEMSPTMWLVSAGLLVLATGLLLWGSLKRKTVELDKFRADLVTEKWRSPAR